MVVIGLMLTWKSDNLFGWAIVDFQFSFLKLLDLAGENKKPSLSGFNRNRI